MRSREVIEKDYDNVFEVVERQIQFEVLLDIRDLLKKLTKREK